MSIGCFYSAPTCYSDVFNESLNLTQCQNGALAYSFDSSNCPPDLCGYSYVTSSANGITIESCLEICSVNGFTYAGLRGM